MTYHGGPRDSIAKMISKKIAEVDSGIGKNRRRLGLKKKYKVDVMSFEEKMKIPAYAAVIELNKRHGIVRQGNRLANGHYRGNKNAATPYKNRYKKKKFVSLPKITMPMGDE